MSYQILVKTSGSEIPSKSFLFLRLYFIVFGTIWGCTAQKRVLLLLGTKQRLY